jgi:hypothetical protein
MVAQAGNQRGKEVRPEDKMAADSQNGDIITLSFFFWWDWSLHSGLQACKAGTLPLEPHLQSTLLWLFWR